MNNKLKIGDTFYLKTKPKNFPELYGKKLTVAILWDGGGITPVEEFVLINEKHITKEIEKLKFPFFKLF